MRPIREWWPDGAAPYLLGGVIGVPFGLAVLHSLPTSTLMAVLGGFLLMYAAYSMLKPESLRVSFNGNNWFVSSLVGVAGGVIGGFTAFPGAAVVVWVGLRGLPKSEARSIVQPFILGLQLVSIALLTVQHPETFDGEYWTLLAITLPIVLPCTLLGVNLYRAMSDIDCRRLTLMLLGVSGLALLVKATHLITLLEAP